MAPSSFVQHDRTRHIKLRTQLSPAPPVWVPSSTRCWHRRRRLPRALRPVGPDDRLKQLVTGQTARTRQPSDADNRFTKITTGALCEAASTDQPTS
jgi:hypothetical protein